MTQKQTIAQIKRSKVKVSKLNKALTAERSVLRKAEVSLRKIKLSAAKVKASGTKKPGKTSSRRR